MSFIESHKNFMFAVSLGRGSGGAPKAVLCLRWHLVWEAKTERSEPTQHPDRKSSPFP